MALLGVAALPSLVRGTDYRLTLAPAAEERAGQVVSFALPADAPARAELRNASGAKLPLQMGADRVATFVVPRQLSSTLGS